MRTNRAANVAIGNCPTQRERSVLGKNGYRNGNHFPYSAKMMISPTQPPLNSSRLLTDP